MQQVSQPSLIPDQYPGTSRTPSAGFRWRSMLPQRIGLPRWSINALLRGTPVSPVSQGASDQELERLNSRMQRLTPQDVRWDTIGHSGTGRRYRI